MLAMQYQDAGLAISHQPGRVPFTKHTMNGDHQGFPQGPFHHHQGSLGGYSDRHPQRSNIPNINTGRVAPPPQAAEMQTPGTAFDMNFTPLLPSQLLLGSPFQPGSPNAFTSPQFQSFGTFTNGTFTNGAANQGLNGQNHVGSPVQPSAALSPTMFHNMAAPNGINGQSYMVAPHSPSTGYAGYATQGLGLAAPMPMNSGIISGTSRTVYLGNIPPETSAEEILNHVRSGQIESVRLLPDKNCAFISFLDSSSATHFHSDAILKRLSIKSQDIKIGWGKPSQVPTSVALAVQQSQASRNVYLGNLPEDITEEEIREELGKFGAIDTVKLVREKSIGFVHFLSIANAVKAVQQLPQEPKWGPPRRVYYGKDRCAYVSKTQQQNAAQYLGIAPGYAHVLNGVDRDVISNALAQQSVAAAAVATAAGGFNNLGNRTVYLGNIHPETTIEEICNVVRGGLLHHIRYIPDKHICFVTFIDPTSAASFYALSNIQGLMIHNRRLKIGWGKHSGPLPPAIALAVSGGASRNVYIGNLDESWSEERLRQDFSEYGEIELVNTLREKSCAFVNFTNIANAIKAIEAVRQKEEYKRFKINFGKDRCGNPPRTMQHPNSASQIQNPHENMSSPSPANGSGRQSSPSQQNGMHSGILNTGSSNPLMMYLQQQQVSNQGQPEQQQSQGSFSSAQAAFYSANLPTSSTPQPLPTLHAPSHSFSNIMPSVNGANGSSPSNGVTNGNVPTTVAGLLAPSTAAQRAQHSRAVSLPVFTPQVQQGGVPQQQQGAVSAMGTGLGGAYMNGNGHTTGLGFAMEGALNGWAEEVAP
jgi:RNA recognition motif-containing protein